MNFKLTSVILGTSTIALMCTAEPAKRGPHGDGWGPGGTFSRMFNSQTVETIIGEVVKVENVVPAQGMGNGKHISVKTDSGIVSVHLGPSWFIDNQEIQIEPKDQVKITGSRITFDGKPAIIASQVSKGDETIKLRDESGRPMWSGWRRGGYSSGKSNSPHAP